MLYYIRDDNNHLIGFEYKNTRYYYQKNIQEDIIGIYNSNYEKVADYSYDSWGNILSIKDNLGNEITDENHIAHINPFRYRSYYYDTETKLYYLNSRYYNPLWGRFINADDVTAEVGNITGINMYQYANNNPISYKDDNGNWPKWLTNVIVGVAVVAVCAVATVLTGGASAGVAGFVAASALKGAVAGAVVGTVIGGTTSAVKNRVDTGSWKNTGNAVVNGASKGFSTGSVSGAVGGALKGAGQIINAARKWDKGTFKSSFDSMKYHYSKHVVNEGFQKGNNIINYTNDAINFASNNSNQLKYQFNYNYNNASWNINYTSGMGGEFKNEGKIYTFWYKNITK